MTPIESRYKKLLQKCYNQKICTGFIPCVLNYIKDDTMEWKSIQGLISNRDIVTYINIFHSDAVDYIYDDKRISQCSIQELNDKLLIEEDRYVIVRLKNAITNLQYAAYKNAYSEYISLTKGQPVNIDSINYDNMPDLQFVEAVTVELTGNIAQDIKIIIRKTERFATFVKISDYWYQTTRDDAKRSAMDIYLLLKHYGAVYTIEEVIKALKEEAENEHLSTWICGGIGRRVYWLTRGSWTYDNTCDRDEFGNNMI